MAKALKHIEDKHKYDRTYGSQQRAGGLTNSHTPANSQNKENQDTNSSTGVTSQPSPFTPTTQIGKITVSDLATKMGSQVEDVAAAINKVQEAQTPTEDLESQVIESQWLANQYNPDNYYVDIESSCSSSNHFNQICVLTLGKWTGTMFPVKVSPSIQVNTLYDTGAAKSCMNYETFFSLGLGLDDKLVLHICTTSGTDMGALGCTTLDFQINRHPFTQQFIVCCRQSRPLILGHNFCIHYCTSCDWSQPPFKMLKLRGKVILQVEEPEASKYISVRKSIKIPPRHYAVTHIWCKKPKGLVTIKPDEVFRRENPLLGWTLFTWIQAMQWSPPQVHWPLTHR